MWVIIACINKNPETEILTVYELCDNCFELKTFVQIIGVYSASLCFNLANRKKKKKQQYKWFCFKKASTRTYHCVLFSKAKN